MNAKLKELTDEELKQVFGGFVPPYPPSAAIRNPKVVAGPDQNGWEDPKYILGGDSDVFTFND